MTSQKKTSPSQTTADKKPHNSTPPAIKVYLVAYNLLSATGWSYIFALIVIHLFNLDGTSKYLHSQSKNALGALFPRLVSSVPFLNNARLSTLQIKLPNYLQPIYANAATVYSRVGAETALVQSLAILEVVHVLFGLVRSPFVTTAMQVSSRLFLVWGIANQFPLTHSNPIYASMVLAWSVTEIIRYTFYASSLLGYNPRFLVWLRYTTFYVLYPVGASSEAFLMFSTLPESSPVQEGKLAWRPAEYGRAILFAIWWPGLYVMYTYMISQRRKVMRVTSGAKSKGLKAN